MNVWLHKQVMIKLAANGGRGPALKPINRFISPSTLPAMRLAQAPLESDRAQDRGGKPSPQGGERGASCTCA